MNDYSLTPEHKEKLKPWINKWVKNSMSTKNMDEEEKSLCRQAAIDMYKAANLEPPKNIVFVDSPYTGMFAAGYAIAIWWFRKNKKFDLLAYNKMYGPTYNATYDAVYGITYDEKDEVISKIFAELHSITHNKINNKWDVPKAIEDTACSAIEAVYDTTYNETCNEIHDITRQEVRSEVYGANYGPLGSHLYAAIKEIIKTEMRAKDLSKWYVYNEDQIEISNMLGVEKFGIECVKKILYFYQAGNQVGPYDAFVSFFQDIAELYMDYSKYIPQRILSEHSSVRFVHKDFCIICDRPEVLTVDSSNRPHNENGPFCRYRDGFAMYAWHGIRVPAWIIEHKELITIDVVNNEQNIEIKRCMIEIKGYEWFIKEANLKPVHTDEWGTLYKSKLQSEELTIVKVVNSTANPDGTYKDYYLSVHPELRPMRRNEKTGRVILGSPQDLTAKNAVASTFGLRGEEYNPLYQS